MEPRTGNIAQLMAWAQLFAPQATRFLLLLTVPCASNASMFICNEVATQHEIEMPSSMIEWTVSLASSSEEPPLIVDAIFPKMINEVPFTRAFVDESSLNYSFELQVSEVDQKSIGFSFGATRSSLLPMRFKLVYSEHGSCPSDMFIYTAIVPSDA